MLLLTGSTGYLGTSIARELNVRGAPFRVLVRNPARLRFDPIAARCDVVVGDLCDPGTLAEALRGVKQLIHSAALVKMWVPNHADFWRVNVEGLKTLLQAAERSGVEKVVYTSSFMAAGPSSDPNGSEGLRNRGPYSNEYEETKARALDWLRTDGFARFPVVALLPGVIYGPGPTTDGNLVGGMIRQYLYGKFPGLLGSGEQRWSFAFIRQIALAHLTALEKARPGEEYFLAGDNRSLNDMFRILSKISGVQRSIRHLPFLAGTAIGTLETVRARLFGHQPQLTPGVVEIFKHDWIYSSAKATRDLGYQVTPLEQGLRRTMEAAFE